MSTIDLTLPPLRCLGLYLASPRRECPKRWSACLRVTDNCRVRFGVKLTTFLHRFVVTGGLRGIFGGLLDIPKATAGCCTYTPHSIDAHRDPRCWRDCTSVFLTPIWLGHVLCFCWWFFCSGHSFFTMGDEIVPDENLDNHEIAAYIFWYCFVSTFYLVFTGVFVYNPCVPERSVAAPGGEEAVRRSLSVFALGVGFAFVALGVARGMPVEWMSDSDNIRCADGGQTSFHCCGCLAAPAAREMELGTARHDDDEYDDSCESRYKLNDPGRCNGCIMASDGTMVDAGVWDVSCCACCCACCHTRGSQGNWLNSYRSRRNIDEGWTHSTTSTSSGVQSQTVLGEMSSTSFDVILAAIDCRHLFAPQACHRTQLAWESSTPIVSGQRPSTEWSCATR